MPKMQGGLYRNPRGKYWLYHFKHLGREYKGSTGHENQAFARTWLRKFRENLSNAEVGLVAEDVPTLDAVFQAWQTAKAPQFTPRHLLNMKSAVQVHARDYLDQPINAIDNAAIEAIRSAYLRSEGLGYRTGQEWTAKRSHTAGGANTVVKMLRGLCGWAVEVGIITRIPFSVKKLKSQSKAKTVLWPEQVKAFLEEADRGGRKSQSKKPDRELPHSAIAIRMMIGLGLREDEAIHADWSWFDRRRKVFVVGRAKDFTVREIPIPEWLHGLLMQLWLDRKKPTSGLILPASTDEDGVSTPHHKCFTQKPVARCSEKLKITGLTPHRLRATFATVHFESGTTLSQIQQMLGHDDPSTTMKYIVQRAKEQAESQEKVAKLMQLSDHTVTRLPEYMI